ncbi:4-coumarate--CoA ligase-like 1 [Iris pallida]|uniref:4-coumarate--CoA ligase-like 1 n=1 Tax=Iris pallida TaxID=29817 RepID=A0AAX6H3H1_IRIPA|nr:4-coumarate--CoA ligase-like 1 [Iris pallida]
MFTLSAFKISFPLPTSIFSVLSSSFLFLSPLISEGLEP